MIWTNNNNLLPHLIACLIIAADIQQEVYNCNMMKLIPFSTFLFWQVVVFTTTQRNHLITKSLQFGAANVVIVPLGRRGRSGRTDAWVDLQGLALSKEWEQRIKEQEHCVPSLMVTCIIVYILHWNLHQERIFLVILSAQLSFGGCIINPHCFTVLILFIIAAQVWPEEFRFMSQFAPCGFCRSCWFWREHWLTFLRWLVRSLTSAIQSVHFLRLLD